MFGRLRLVAMSLVAATALSGCVAAGVELTRAGRSTAIISRNIDAANAGDAEAQYQVGAAHCCSVNEGSGLFNTRTSVEWLCRAARQGHPPAMTMLGKIYSGDVIDGVRLTRRVAQGIVGTSENIPVAVAWLQEATRRGEADAAARATDLLGGLSAADRARVAEYGAMGLGAPCDWGSVIGQ